MRLPQSITSALVLAAAALASVAAAWLGAARLETASRASVEAALRIDGHDWAEVGADGLILTLGGEAPDDAARFRALNLAHGLVDERRVFDGIRVAASNPVQAPPFKVEIIGNDAGVTLTGLVPASTDRAAFADGVARVSGRPVTDFMEGADYPAPADWERTTAFAFRALERLPLSRISVSAGRVEVSAVAEDGDARRRVEAELGRLAPEGIDLALDISAPRPVVSPFTLRFVLDGAGGRFDACTAHSRAGRARILAAAREAGLAGEADCVLAVGAPSPQWADAVATGLRGLGDLGGGSITYSDTSVSLVAPEGADRDLFDEVVGRLETRLPEYFSLAAARPEPAAADGSGEDGRAEPPEFVATLSPEGILQLRGRVSDERQRLAVTGFARARFPEAEVAPAMRLDGELPDGWAKRVLAGLDALSNLSSGALVVRPDFLDIRGRSNAREAEPEVSRILSAELGGAAQFAIDVAYVAPPEPEAVVPSPGECVDAINGILRESKVTFEPGSVEIAEAGFPTIDLIAEAMADCAHVPMEIAGHTDSQGREEMNLRLSEQRARAVRVALQERRVLIGNLAAAGYGESEPVADNGTEEGREANRRIEFRLRGRGAPGAAGAAPPAWHEDGTLAAEEREDGQN